MGFEKVNWQPSSVKAGIFLLIKLNCFRLKLLPFWKIESVVFYSSTFVTRSTNNFFCLKSFSNSSYKFYRLIINRLYVQVKSMQVT